VNKRRRAILDALVPVVTFVAEQRVKHGTRARDLADVPGLAMRARVSADASAELMIYGAIGGGGWFSEGVSASDVAAALRELGPGPLNVRINSGGGDVFDGVAIHSLLARHAGTVTVYVDGLAASAASFIMLAGDRIVAARNSFIMIHDAMTGTWGNRAAHQRALDLLDKVSDNIADMYAERAGEDAEFWRAKMLENGEDGVWYTGQEAMTAGLVDEITEVDDDDVDDRLTGWVDFLPEPIAAGIQNRINARKSDDPDDDSQNDNQPAGLDRATLKNIMKEVFA
jgi:ATP-dependent protease ClpP protease subunit